MRRARRTKILVEGNPELLRRMSDAVEQRYSIRMIRRPEPSLVMCQIRDSVTNRKFYMGEALITECTVRLGESYGFGAVRGDAEETAYRLALIDASFRAEVPEIHEWTDMLEAEELEIERKRRAEYACLQRSRVRFDD